MARIAWQNRDNLGYSYKILTQGVCDGCALGVSGLKDWTIPGVHLCMTRLNLLRLNTMPAMDEGELADVKNLEGKTNRELRGLGRLPYPMIREADDAGFRRISWREALEYVAKTIRNTSPERLAFYLTARGLTNEVYYVAQKAARFLGTNHIENASRLCHSPSTIAMKSMIGVAASTCSYRDWIGTDLLVFFGSNPANDQPVSTKYLLEAKRKGTRVVLVNPYREPGMDRYWVPSNLGSALFGTQIADDWFPVAQGGDIAFISGVLRLLIEKESVDAGFIQAHTAGFEELRDALLKLDWQELETQSGLNRESMEAFAEMIRTAKTGVFVWSMGITQHGFGADAVRMILNLGLSQGWAGRDHCGLMPIRGHSSVQGSAEMGAYATVFPGGKPVNAVNAKALSEHYGFEVPDWTGMTTSEMMEAALRGDLEMVHSLGGNFIQTLPEPERVKRALTNLPVRVHQDILVTDQMLLPARRAVLLLPAKTRYEQDDGGTETSTERRVMFTPEIPRQVGEAHAEWKILRDLAAAVDPDNASKLGCESGQAIREEIARVIPMYDGVQNLKKAGDAFQYGGRHLCANGNFQMPDGKARFQKVAVPMNTRVKNRFHVSTRRGKQFNTLIYAEVDPMNNAPRNAILVNEQDARALGFSNGEPAELKSDTGAYRGRIFFAPLAQGSIQVHWPEANPLLPSGKRDPESGIPDYTTHVELRKIPVVPVVLHAN